MDDSAVRVVNWLRSTRWSADSRRPDLRNRDLAGAADHCNSIREAAFHHGGCNWPGRRI